VHVEDIQAITDGKPALGKAQAVEKIKRLINRSGFKEQFAIHDGVTALSLWITPLAEMGEQAEPPLSVVDGVLWCLQTLGPNCTKDDVKETGIGVQVKRILKDGKYPRDTRLAAQSLISAWVSYITGGPEKRSAAEANDEEEAIEVDERGRKVARPDDDDDHRQMAMMPGVGAVGEKRAKTEREKNAFWQPTGEDLKVIEERRQMRHAVLPMDKPVFDASCLPPSNAPAKRKAKEDPHSITGKLSGQLQKISNPNKKAWKSTVGQVSVSGRDIVYKW